jgi:hypothetical protein
MQAGSSDHIDQGIETKQFELAAHVSQMRLRTLSHVDANECAHDPLLSLLGSNAWRHLGGPVCDSKPVRQDLLDELVWREVVKLKKAPIV